MPDAAWQEAILAEFTPGASRLTAVADPDGLLRDHDILAGLHERGFSLLRFEDPVAFRYAYESQHRDQADVADLIVWVEGPPEHLERLPHDVLARCRRLELSLGDLFPGLNHAVVAALEGSDLGLLYEAIAGERVAAVGEHASKDLVLQRVFGIYPEHMQTPVALLSALLRRHYAGRHMPPMLDARLIKAIKAHFPDWPLESIVPDRDAFFRFLQRAWRPFVDRQSEGGHPVRDAGGEQPPLLPFDHEDVRVYVDNLFAEGYLLPIEHWNAGALSETWLGVGIQWDERKEAATQLDRLLATASDSLPEAGARHEDWLRFAEVWARIALLTHRPDSPPNEEQEGRLRTLQTRMDAAFHHWMRSRYASLASLPPNPPVMLHHIPRFLAGEIGSGAAARVALVVVDGLALDQWAVLRQELVRQRPGWRFREGAAFAWVPTVTSVSRQAAFAGMPPFYFPNSIHTTSSEAALWRRFWEDQGIAGAVYAKSLGDAPFKQVAALVEPRNVRVAGLVVDKVDSIMHGMALGAAGMHNQVRQWAAEGHFATLLDVLFAHGFRVYVTADHGNIEAIGSGRPKEGALADVRGERVRVYSNERLRRHIAETVPAAAPWPGDGLPPRYLPLLAPDRRAFVLEGERVVAHGGVCLEEVVVPFVRVELGG